MKRLASLAFLVAACSRDPVSAVAVPDAGPAFPSLAMPVARRGAAENALALDCAICHSIDLVQSQHLSRAQWDKELKKMTGWGAPVDGEDAPLLLELLSTDFPPDGGAPPPTEITPSTALAEVTPDAIPAPGDPRRGEALYQQACTTCHGPAAEGTRGPSLIGKPIVHRAHDFTDVVAHGRGRMPAFSPALPSESIADLRAFLATKTP